MKTFTVREKAIKGIEFKFTKGGQNAIFGIPVGQGLMKPFAGLEEARATLHWMDIAEREPRFIREENPRDRRALVLVETAAGIDGEVRLSANTVVEVWDEKKGRVERVARPIEEAVGVEIVAERPAVEGKSAEFLVLMKPGASFRITRTGKLSGAPPELVVLWNGRWDQTGFLRELERVLEAGGEPDDQSMMKYWGLSVYERGLRHG